MDIVKLTAASTSYGRGPDNYRSPATYAVLDAAGARVGLILGTRAGYMQKSRWEVCWVSPAGVPRTVHYADSFRAAKTWAEQWDGVVGVRPEWVN